MSSVFLVHLILDLVSILDTMSLVFEALNSESLSRRSDFHSSFKPRFWSRNRRARTEV